MATETSCVYTATTSKTFEDACVAVRRAAEAHKFGILGSHEFSEILTAKGFPQPRRMKSIEICAPGHANALLSVEPLVGLCMPCSILVFTDDGQTRIATILPSSVMPHVFPEAAQKAAEVVEQVSRELRAIVDGAAA